MVGVIFMLVDRLAKRTPRNGQAYYIGSCIIKAEPSKILSLRMTEPQEAIDTVLKMNENQFGYMTNVILTNEALNSSRLTNVSLH